MESVARIREFDRLDRAKNRFVAARTEHLMRVSASSLWVAEALVSNPDTETYTIDFQNLPFVTMSMIASSLGFNAS